MTTITEEIINQEISQLERERTQGLSNLNAIEGALIQMRKLQMVLKTPEPQVEKPMKPKKEGKA